MSASDITYSESGRLLKMEVDYSATVDEKLPVCEKLTAEGRLQEALDILLALEKQTRTGADTHSTSRVLVAIVNLCFKSNNFEALNEQIMTLTKRRSQIKQAITAMIQECCKFVDQITDKERKLQLIDTLRTVTAGKIYVETERARLTHILAQIYESEGKIEDAAKVMQELQVETFGTMDKREKTELILEQMRLCLARNDYIKTQIISKKIQTRYFDDKEVEDLKFRYYKLMIQLDLNESSYLAVCKHFRALYDSASIQENESKRHEVLKHMVLYIILAPYDQEQSDLIHRVASEKALEEIPIYRQLLKMYTTPELIQWRVVDQTYARVLRVGNQDCPATGVFGADEAGEKRWNDLKSRVVEHNIRIMARYYSRITLQRMAQLLDLSIEESEEKLSDLVVNKTVYARVDRLEGIVCFSPGKDPNQVLNEWSRNINTLMLLVSKTNHLINKEEMVHQHLHAQAGVASE